MTQIATALIAAAAMLFGYKLMRKEADRQAEAVRAKATTNARVQKDLGSLVWDDRTGVYRPRG